MKKTKLGQGLLKALKELVQSPMNLGRNKTLKQGYGGNLPPPTDDDCLTAFQTYRNVGLIKQGDVVVWQSPYKMGTYTAECDQVGPVPSGTFYATVNGKVVIKL